MISIPSPMCSTERQRKFRAANPGYDRLRKARQRSGAKAAYAKWIAEQAAQAKLTPAAVDAPPAVAPQPAPLLMLPAPVVDPLTAEMNALSAALAQRKAEHHAVPTDR